MKRILLFCAAALLSVGVSASDRTKLLSAQKKQDLNMHLGAFNSFQSQMQAGHLFDSNVKKVLKAPAKAEVAEPELIPAYSTEINYYLDSMAFVTQNLYDGASFLVDGDKAYFAPFAYCDYVEGKVEKEECWYQKLLNNLGLPYKVDSITFTANKVIAKDEAGNKYVAAVGQLDPKKYTAERTSEETFGAYYFPDYKEFAVSSIIGLYDQAGTKSTPVQGYCYADFDLQPQEIFIDYFYNATFSVKDAFDKGEDVGKVYKGDAIVYAADDGMYIKGIDLYTGGHFVKFEYPEDNTSETGYDNSSATVSNGQLFTWAESKTGDYYDAITYGVDANFKDATVGFFINSNDDHTVSIESDGMALLLAYIPGIGSLEALQDLSITVTPEKTFANIKSAATAKATATAYYDMQGRKVNADHKGLIIKKSVMSDGSVKSEKIIKK